MQFMDHNDQLIWTNIYWKICPRNCFIIIIIIIIVITVIIVVIIIIIIIVMVNVIIHRTLDVVVVSKILRSHNYPKRKLLR